MKWWLALASLAVIPAFASYQPDAQRQEFARKFQVDNPKIVKDVMWRSARTLLVGVLDNGQARNGLAAAYCEDVRDFGLKGPVHVQIMDIAKIKANGKWVKLGEHACR
jgi:hypothetical protein